MDNGLMPTYRRRCNLFYSYAGIPEPYQGRKYRLYLRFRFVPKASL
jgi:hypothetical protein